MNRKDYETLARYVRRGIRNTALVEAGREPHPLPVKEHEMDPENEPDKSDRCTHRGCHVPATRIVSYRDKNGVLRRGRTCGNHESDKPKH